MQKKTKERWMELCEQAVVEQDPERLLTLTQEINRLLQEKLDSFKLARQENSQEIAQFKKRWATS